MQSDASAKYRNLMGAFMWSAPRAKYDVNNKIVRA
jgi:hypothetical protein